MVSIMSLLVEGLTKYVPKSTKNLISPPSFLDSSFNIENILLRFSVLILHIVMPGTVSQIFYLGPSFYFMLFRLQIKKGY